MNQDQALQILKSGSSVFLTGEPGSGKTYTIQLFTTWLKKHKVTYAVTATTGLAATHIGGKTIHAWSGIGTHDTLTESELKKICMHTLRKKRINSTQVLIIDEISMLGSQKLDLIDLVCRTVRKCELPFGGIQVILVGDFYQLPPVVRHEERQCPLNAPDNDFAFDALAWASLDPKVCYLTSQHRQKDHQLLDVLRAIRAESVSEEHKNILTSRIVQYPPQEVTHFMPRNHEVDHINETRLAAINEKGHVYTMRNTGDEALVEQLMRYCPSPDNLALKKGAMVMFTKNDIRKNQYVNGTIGKVIDFQKVTNLPIVMTTHGKKILAEPVEWSYEDAERIMASISQVPLRLGWAITIHKSQGMSLDAAHIDLSRAFEYGQGYVALSRVRSLAGLTLSGFNLKALQVSPKIVAIDTKLRAASDHYARELSVQSKGDKLTIYHSQNTSFSPTVQQTVELYRSGMNVDEIMHERQLTESTIFDHLSEWYGSGGDFPYSDFVTPEAETQILLAAKSVGFGRLTKLKEALPESITYHQLRLVRAKLSRTHKG